MTLLVALQATAHAATLTAPGAYGTIQGAIDASAPGDVIAIDGGTHDELLSVPHDLTLRGNATLRTELRPDPASTLGTNGVVYAAPGVVLTVESVDVVGANTRGFYGDTDSSLQLLDVYIADSAITDAGGGVWSDGDVDATDLSLFNVHALDFGGGLWVSGDLTCSSCSFALVDVVGTGGAIFHLGDVLRLVDVEYYATADNGFAGGVYTSSSSAELVRNHACGVNGLLFGAGGGGSVRASGVVGNGGPAAFALVSSPGLTWELDHVTARDHQAALLTYDIRYVPALRDTATGDSALPPIDTASAPGTVSVTNSLFVDNDSLMVPFYGDPILLLPTFDHIAYDVTLDPSVVVTNSVSEVDVRFQYPVLVPWIVMPEQNPLSCPIEWFLPTYDAEVIDAGSGYDPDGSIADIGASGGPDTWPAFHTDGDGDGYTLAKDCNDDEVLAYPYAYEVCDGVDNDCNFVTDQDAIDQPTWFPDNDDDGYGDGQSPADSGLTQCFPPDPYDIGSIVHWAPNGSDCDDADASVNPSAAEDCDLATDLNCDGSPDAGAADAASWWPDLDDDGFGDATAVPLLACAAPGPQYTAANGDDCNDDTVAIQPGATDTCNGIDENCSGDESDATDLTVWWPDLDGDGYPATAGEIHACDAPGPDYIQARGDLEVDCDDAEAAANPMGTEVCDGLDNDCSGLADDLTQAPPSWHPDDDGDGFGSADPAAAVATDCPADGYVEDATDCDDADDGTHPGATEFCNGQDDDCSGTPDDGPELTLYVDGDGDGWGGEEVTTSCPGPKLVEQGGDCQDAYPDVNPGAEEVPGNDVDEDCDGSAARPASSPSGEPAASGCQCSSSSPAGAWLGLFTFALILRRRSGVAAALGLAACATEPADDRLPEVRLTFPTLTEASVEAPRFALDTEEGPALLQRDSRATFRPDGSIELHHRGTGSTPLTAQLALQSWGREELEPVPAAAEPDVLGPRVVLERGSLVEWYLNGPDGLEQGFTVRERRGGRGPLRLAMAVDGLQVSGGDDGLTFADDHGVARFRYDKLVVVDRHDEPVPARLDAHCEAVCTVELVIDDGGAAYPLYVDPLLSEYVTDVIAVDAVANFGTSVDVDGDRAVIGAPAGLDSRVFILERNVGNPDAWGLEDTLFNAADSFGTVVAIDDPFLVVGAPEANTVMAYIRNGSSWSEHGDYTGSGRLGAAIDLQGPNLFVGAPEGDGALYLGGLDRATQLSALYALTVAAADPGGELGTTVAVQFPSLIAGAPGSNGDQGAVLVMGGEDLNLDVRQRIDGGPGERLGEVLAVSSARMALGVPTQSLVRLYDLNPDAPGQLIPSADPVVTAPSHSETGFGSSLALLNDTLLIGDQGTATAWAHQYAFVDGDTWLHTQSLPVAGGTDGRPLALALNSRTIIAGAPGAGTVGEAAVWARTGNDVIPESVLQVDDGNQFNQGRAVAIDGDLAVVGDETALTTFGGRVDLYANSGAGWSLDHTFFATTHIGSDGEFGHGVAIEGDIVVVGAPEADQAFIYTRQVGGWSEELLVDPLGGATRFGEAVALGTGVIAIGAPKDDGRVHIYTLNGSDRLAGPVSSTIPGTPATGAGTPTKLGSSVAIDGDIIAVGAPGWDTAGVTDAGAVELYTRSAFTTAFLQRIEGIDPDDRCGIAVAVDADRVAVGCPNDGAFVGKSLLYRGDASGYALEAQDAGNDPSNFFGTAVALDGDRWFIGAKGLSRVRLNQRNTGGEDQWGEELIIDGPNGSNFGTAMDIDGNTVIIGAPLDGAAGSARIYTLDGTIPPTVFDDSYTVVEDAVDVPLDILTNDILAGNAFTPADALTTNGPGAGTLTRYGGELLFTPDPDVNGQQTFEYQLNGSLTLATVTIDITPINDLPVAADDDYDVDEEVLLNGASVLTNDSDIESPTLTANLLTGPSSAATFALYTDGTFVYEGAVDFYGTDSFTYEAIDGDGAASSPATVTITVNDTPESPILTDSSWTTDRDVPLEVPAPGLADVAYAELPSEDTLFSLADDSLLDGTVLVLGNGGFTYLPDPGFTGSTQFVVRATSAGGSDTAFVTIDVADTNQAPIPQPDSYTVREDTDLVVSLNGVLSNDADPDGDELQALFDVPNQGTLVDTDTDGTFTYRPPADVHGSAFFVYQATDGSSVSPPVVVDIVIEPVNDPPVALDDAYDLEGPGPHVIPADGLLANDSDIDGDGLAASLLRATDEGQVSVSADGGFVFTPRAGFEGITTFEYLASDGLTAAKAEVELTVSDNALPLDTGDSGPVATVDTASACDDEWFPDRDGDGCADDDSEPRTACDAPPGFTDQRGDCDDGRADVHPGAPEVQADGIDQDCDGADADIAPAGACATGSPAGALGSLLLVLLARRRREVA